MRSSAAGALFRFVRPYWWMLPVLVVLGIAASLAEGLGIGLIIPALDVLLETGAARPSGPFAEFMQRFAGRFAEQNVLVVLGVLIVALVSVKTVILVLQASASASIVGRITNDLRIAIARQLLEVGMAFHARSDQGHLLNTLDGQTYRTGEALTALSVLISSLTTIFVFGTLLLLLSWQMALVVFAAALPVTLLVRVLSNRARHNGEQFVSGHSHLVGQMVEMLNGMRTIRLFNQEEAQAERFSASAEEVRRTFVRSERLVRVLPAAVELLYVPVFIAVLVYAFRVDLGLSSVLVFLLLLYRLQNPMKSVDASRVILSNFAGGVAEVDRLLDRSDKPYLDSGSHVIEGLEQEIRFDDVSFCYQAEGTPALSNVSFAIPKGSIFAIAGSSGAGKSTLINLLCRFYDPDEGAVLVDRTDLREADLVSWRDCIAFAGQDAELMSGSVAWNIAFGHPDADPDAVRDAARVARAADFIEALPQGYDTYVGMRGARLSGGQRQRIALARALLRKPEVLILDEATNAIDSRTEQAIQGAIEALSGTTTIIIIAHRLTALRNADHVVVLEHGRIVEVGPPAVLAGADGPLARLYASENPAARVGESAAGKPAP